MILVADVAMGRMIASFVGIGILILAVCVLMIFAIVKIIKKNRSAKIAAPDPVEAVSEEKGGKETAETKE